MRIPLHAPLLGAAESAAVAEALASGWISSAGPQVTAFEAAVAADTGVAHAIAVQSGTAALHLALQAAGVQPGDRVAMPALTFIAPANAAHYLGAAPLLVDVSPLDWQLDIDLLEAHLAHHYRRRGMYAYDLEGRRLAAVVAVHVLGHLGDMARLADLCHRWGVALIEDAAEAVGSARAGRAAGTWGRAGCYSFNGNKILSCGGGGMVLTDDPDLAQRVRHLSTQAKAGPGPYDHDEVGYNYRLPALAAALGLAQWQRLPDLLARKTALATRYRAALAAAPWTWRPVDPAESPNHWLVTPCHPARDALWARLTAAGIEARPLWRPLHQQQPYRHCIYLTQTDVAARLAATALSLPSSPGLSQAEQDKVLHHLMAP